MASTRQFAFEKLAIPAVATLVVFLAYSSQYLFNHIDPGPLSRREAIWFNIALLALWWFYYNACTVDPGPKGWVNGLNKNHEGVQASHEAQAKKSRWCKKCDNVKPPRAHHCKKCQRCIPKMDHHCPWTTNCVSHTTFPHFIRFVFYAVLSMSILSYHLYVRCRIIWTNRNLPAYLGPPTWAFVHLFCLLIVNSLTLFALGILLARTLYSMAGNVTMIEEWEIERHEALVERSRKKGGIVYGSGGQKMRVQKQEFPYDIGIWKNICQALDTNNVLLWFLPVSGSPSAMSALEWEENGFEDAATSWPPPDPDKLPRSTIISSRHAADHLKDEDRIAAFNARQSADMRRRTGQDSESSESDEYASDGEEEGIDGERGWTNSEGDRLNDYGVDEDTEVLDEDDIPLGELLRRRKVRSFE